MLRKQDRDGTVEALTQKGRLGPGLIVCRDLQGVNATRRLAARYLGGVVVASNDPRVHEAVRDIETVQDAVFLEKVESYYCVADDVISILRRVNEWLGGLSRAEGIQEDLLRWAVHCEGGDTSQRALDLLLMMRSYRELLARFGPREVIVVRSASATWEDELLFAVAAGQRLLIRYTGRLGPRGWFKRHVWHRLRPLVIGPYRIGKLCETKARGLVGSRPEIDDARSVMVQLVGSSKNHLNHSVNLLQAVNEAGLQGVALGWHLGESAAAIRERDIAVIQLEDWIAWRDIVASWLGVLKVRVRASTELGALLPNTAAHDYGAIRSVLSKSLLSFIWTEFLDRSLFERALRNFLGVHMPLALRPHALVLPLGVIAYRVAVFYNPDLLLFAQGGWPYNVPDPITDSEQPIPRRDVLFFCIGEKHRAVLVEKGFLSDNVRVAGLHWLEPIVAFHKLYAKSESRTFLKLRAEAELYLLFDPNYALRGVLTGREQYEALVLVLDFAAEHNGVEVMIKPHPCHTPGGVFEATVERYALDNVHIIDQSTLPYHAINAADIVVTKLSTLVLEAMFLNVPALGVVLDGERKFMCYGNAVDYHLGLRSLHSRLSRLLRDRHYRDGWFAEMRHRRHEYLQEQGIEASAAPARSVAEVLSARLKAGPIAGRHVAPQ